MARIYLLIMLLLISVSCGVKQVSVVEISVDEAQHVVPDEQKNQRRNALPPGPTRIWGTLVDVDGDIISNAIVTVKYPDGLQREADTFVANEDGRFLVYVFRSDQPFVELEIKKDNNILGTIHYENPRIGANIGHPTHKIVIR